MLRLDPERPASNALAVVAELERASGGDPALSDHGRRLRVARALSMLMIHVCDRLEAIEREESEALLAVGVDAGVSRVKDANGQGLRLVCG